MNSFLTRFRIGPRLSAAFLLLLLGMSGLCGLALLSLAQLAAELRVIKDDRLPKVEQLVQIADNTNKVARQIRNVVIFDDAAKRIAWLASIDAAMADSARLMALVEPAVRSQEGRELLALTRRQGERFDAELNGFLSQVRAGEMAGATAALETKLRDAQLAYMKALDRMKTRELERIGMTAELGQVSYRHSRNWVMAGGAALLAMGVLLSWAITRSIVAPLRSAVHKAARIAEGDLSLDMQACGRDEAAELLRALAHMQQGLRGIVSEVRQGVASVAAASLQIAQGNQDLSSRTEQQASSLQQTAASMEQISGNVRAGSANAEHASGLANQAFSVAHRGGDLVEQAVTQISHLETSSQRIADIVGVIDGIAFQTNLLALNAAVEAARAGASGRGFAVVAAEVRSLAQRCADAAREIKGLVDHSVAQVQDSSSLVRHTGSVMGEIVAQVQGVSGLVGQISQAAREQDQGIAEVHVAMGELDQMTQRNAALVEESAAAAESLRRQAERLSAAVASFRLDAGELGASAPA